MNRFAANRRDACPTTRPLEGKRWAGSDANTRLQESLTCNFACSRSQGTLAFAAPLFSFCHDYVHRAFFGAERYFLEQRRILRVIMRVRERILRKNVSHPFIWWFVKFDPFRTTIVANRVRAYMCTFCCETSTATERWIKTILLSKISVFNIKNLF